MRRPGVRLRALAARVCSERTLSRLVDPTLADLQAEHAEAIRRGRTWERRWAWLRGHVALARVLAVHGAGHAVDVVRDATPEDRRTLARTFIAGALTMAVATLVLAVLPMLQAIPRHHPHATAIAFYYVPGTLTLSIPAALAAGLLWGLGRAKPSRRSRALLALAAVATSTVSVVLLAWVVPASNQAFRVTFAGRPLVKGANELTIGELGRLITPGAHQPMQVMAPNDLRSLTLAYHSRWSLACTPLTLAIFAFALTRRRPWPVPALTLASVLTIGGFCVLLVSARELARFDAIPEIVVAWMPNVVLLAASLATTKHRQSAPPTLQLP